MAWEEDPHFLYLCSLGIGVAIGSAADHRQSVGQSVLLGVVTAVACGLCGNLAVTLLERDGTITEFDLVDYVIGLHASERLDERGIMEWQAVVGLEPGKLILGPTQPNRAVEVPENLPDGIEAAVGAE